MIEDMRLKELWREIAREILQRGEEERKRSLESIAHTWATWDRLRETLRRQHLGMWLDDIARRLGRPRSTIRLLSITETYALQKAEIEAMHRWHTGQIPGFEREVPIVQSVEIERLIDKLRMQTPDIPVHLLYGTNINLLSSDEPDEREVWNNASGLFGAVEATSNEILVHAMTCLDRGNHVDITLINAITHYDLLTLSQVATSEGVFYVLGMTGISWGQLLANERSDWDYVQFMEQAVKIRAQNLR